MLPEILSGLRVLNKPAFEIGVVTVLLLLPTFLHSQTETTHSDETQQITEAQNKFLPLAEMVYLDYGHNPSNLSNQIKTPQGCISVLDELKTILDAVIKKNKGLPDAQIKSTQDYVRVMKARELVQTIYKQQKKLQKVEEKKKEEPKSTISPADSLETIFTASDKSGSLMSTAAMRSWLNTYFLENRAHGLRFRRLMAEPLLLRIPAIRDHLIKKKSIREEAKNPERLNTRCKLPNRRIFRRKKLSNN